MRKNQQPYTYVGWCGVENGCIMGVGWVWVLHPHYAQSYKIVNFQGPAQGERLFSLAVICTHSTAELLLILNVENC